MKKHLILFIIFICSFSLVKAAPGDTTWVQANSDTWLSWYNNYDTTITLPSTATSYRKIYMIFTLGKYVCPGSPQYCGDWDYTVQTYFMAKNNPDTVELGRFMTPYAHTGYYRFTNAWTQRYIFDVTDYYTVLHDTGTVRIHYSGYSGGFTANVRFAFVEGTPERNVIGVDRLWHGDFNYGHGAVPINTALGAMAKTAPAGTQSAEVKMNITGHGGDDNACAEFCPNRYTLALNGNMLAEQDFFRTNCDNNELYAQTGTWVYSRANWCPGALVNTISHMLTGVGSGAYSLGLTFPAYTSTTNSPGTFAASYTIDATAIYYGSMNKTLDASIEDIMAPSNAEYHFRENPAGSAPVITLRNSGATTINSIKFQYGVTGYATQTYTWTTGNLASLQTMDISLPDLADLRLNPGTYQFQVKILEVNGQSDADSLNNSLSSTFSPAPILPSTLIVKLTANNEGLATNAAICETSWRIEDASGNIVKEKKDCPINALCVDTVDLVFGAAYKLIVVDSSYLGYYDVVQNTTVGIWQGDGLSGFSSGSGAVRLYRPTSSIPLTLPGYYNGNFGRGFVMEFFTGWATGITHLQDQSASVSVFPNPARGTVSISLTGLSNVKGDITFVDALGKTVLRQPCNSPLVQVSTSGLASGVYTVVFTDKQGKLQTRLLIAN